MKNVILFVLLLLIASVLEILNSASINDGNVFKYYLEILGKLMTIFFVLFLNVIFIEIILVFLKKV